MKKILSLALCAAMLALLAGCATKPAPSAQPTDAPTAAPSAPADSPDAAPSQPPSDAPDDPVEPEPKDMEGSFGYALRYDPALFAFAAADGKDTFTPLSAQDAQTSFVVSTLAKDAVAAYEAEHMGQDKQAVLIGTGSYAANMGVTTEQTEDGSAVTRSFYTVALESGDALCIEIVRVGDACKDALDAMLSSLTLR